MINFHVGVHHFQKGKDHNRIPIHRVLLNTISDICEQML